MNFDIDQLASSTETTYNVDVGRNPDKPDGTPGDVVGFTVLGPSSKAFLAVERDIQVLNVREAEKRKGVPLDLSTEEGATSIVDGQDRRKLMIVKRCVVGWYGFMRGSEPAPFTLENLGTVLASRPHWVKRIADAIDNQSNFDGG
jgi:hypothetical protein